MNNKKIVIGLSGGVDSSVAAYLLKQKGYDVHALYMINWHDTQGVIEGNCPSDDDVLIAGLIARKLKIPFHVVDFSKEYRKKVVDYMFDEYQKGRTPNPDVLCNREIKFDVFMKKALEYGADLVATGHYCRKDTIVKNGQKIYRLLAGKDPKKDQSYFLCQLSQKQLEKAVFPIGELEKSEVRRIAEEKQLASAKKKDSQGICFVGKVDLPVFLQQKLKPKTGDIVKIDKNFQQYSDKDKNTDDFEKLSTPYKYKPENGTKIAEHRGAYYYTIGQRKGLGIGGMKEPPYVIATDVNKNIVYIGEGKMHPGLFRKALFIKKEEIHYIREDLKDIFDENLDCLVQIRYRQIPEKAVVRITQKGMFIIFEEKQRGITPGQFAAIYIQDELIASGVID